MAEARERPAHRARSRGLSVLREVALNDWLAFVYLVMLNAILFAAEPSRERTMNQWRFGSLFVGYTLLVVWVRASADRTRWPHALAYRAAQFAAVLGSYLMFRDYLPVANPNSLDL